MNIFEVNSSLNFERVMTTPSRTDKYKIYLLKSKLRICRHNQVFERIGLDKVKSEKNILRILYIILKIRTQ